MIKTLSRDGVSESSKKNGCKEQHNTRCIPCPQCCQGGSMTNLETDCQIVRAIGFSSSENSIILLYVIHVVRSQPIQVALWFKCQYLSCIIQIRPYYPKWLVLWPETVRLYPWIQLACGILYSRLQHLSHNCVHSSRHWFSKHELWVIQDQLQLQDLNWGA